MVNNKFTLALKVQGIKKSTNRVLIIANSVGLIKGDGWVKPKDILDLFLKLKIPEPSNIYQDLNWLKKNKLVLKNTNTKKWTLTPKGKVRVEEILESLDLDRINLETDYKLGSYFGHAFHATIPPDFAPPKWQKGISQLLEKYPFETNVFLMTRFPDDENDHTYLDPLSDAIDIIKNVLSNYGLNLHLASDRQIDDDLLGNVAAHMWSCNYGIGLLEDRLKRGLNYNVVTELGAMLMTGRRCALIKDTSVPYLPTDMAGLIYKPTDLSVSKEVKKSIESWASNDLALSNNNSK